MGFLIELMIKHLYDVRMFQFHMHLYFVVCELPTNLFDGYCGTSFETLAKLDRSISSKAKTAGDTIGCNKLIVGEDGVFGFHYFNE